MNSSLVCTAVRDIVPEGATGFLSAPLIHRPFRKATPSPHLGCCFVAGGSVRIGEHKHGCFQPKEAQLGKRKHPEALMQASRESGLKDLCTHQILMTIYVVVETFQSSSLVSILLQMWRTQHLASGSLSPRGEDASC